MNKKILIIGTIILCLVAIIVGCVFVMSNSDSAKKQKEEITNKLNTELKDIPEDAVIVEESGEKICQFQDEFGTFDDGTYSITYKDDKITNSYYQKTNIVEVPDASFNGEAYDYDKESATSQMNSVTTNIFETAENMGYKYIYHHITAEENNVKTIIDKKGIEDYIDGIYHADIHQSIRYITYEFENENGKKLIFSFFRLTFNEFDLIINES